MSAMNPPWDPRVAALRDAATGFGFGPSRRGGFRAAMAADRGGPHHDHDPEHERPGRRRHGGARFGTPFGPGGPGFGPGGPRGRRGRRTNRGDVRSVVLALVAEQPRHGYDIIQEIGNRTGGAWRPSPGSVYPTLSQLEDEGLVRVEQSEGRRVVQLTEAGTAYVAEHREELDKVWESATRDGDDDSTALWTQLGQLHAAAQQVMATGTPEQMQTATASITEARKAIYRLLAE